MFGEAIASSLILARRMCSPSLYLPAFMSRNSCSDSSAGRLRKRRIGARRAEIAAVLRHLFGALAVDVGVAVLDQVLGHRVQLVEVVAGVVQVLLAVLLPRETEPLDAVDDGVDVFLVFLLGIGVVEAQVAAAAVVARQAEVQADRFGVADVQVAVRLRREAGDHGRQALAGMGAGGQVVIRRWRAESSTTARCRGAGVFLSLLMR